MFLGWRCKSGKKNDGNDENALLCSVPRVLPESIANVKMESKSSGKSYLMKDVLGKPIGRVNYFVNDVLSQLLDERKVRS